MPPPRPDPLASLARLRRFETLDARRRLAERLSGLAAAEARRDAAAAAITAEAATGDGAAYAAWLPRGLAERDRARGGVRLAEERVLGAQGTLAAARTAERVVELLREQRAAEARREAARRDQAALDEAAVAVARMGGAAPAVPRHGGGDPTAGGAR